MFGALCGLIPLFRCLWVYCGYVIYGGVPHHALEGITSETTKFDVVLSDVRNRNALEMIPALRRTELPKTSELTKAS